LVEKIIVQLKIATQFDEEIRALPSSVTAETQEGRIQIWLAEVRVRELGWANVRGEYVRAIKDHFSESELAVLVNRLDDPIIEKLMLAHLESMRGLSTLRANLFERYWIRYNNGEFSPPDDVIGEKKK
jgi:hypothetical protein